MRKNLTVTLLLILSLMFFVACVGDEEEDGIGGGETNNAMGSTCNVPGSFSCNQNIVLICDEDELQWQKLRECSSSQVCNAQTGKCDSGNSGNSGNSDNSGNSGEQNNHSDPGETTDDGGNGDGGNGNGDGNDDGGNGGNGNDDGGNNQPQCTPKCENKECGDDGCGGVCGSCGGNQGCSSAGKCEDLKVEECTGLSLDWNTFSYAKTYYNWYVDDAESTTELQMSFVDEAHQYYAAPTVGTHKLGEGNNENYKTCTECLLYLSDVDENGMAQKLYFPKSGEMKIDSYDKDANSIKGSLSAKFLEVSIANDGTTTFKTDSKCLEIQSGSFECVPQCGTRSCGSNGCGGLCGSCGDDETCNAEGKCVTFDKMNCSTLSVPSDKIKLVEPDSGAIFYRGIITEAADTSLSDLLVMEFFKEDGYSSPAVFSDVKYIDVLFYEDMYNQTTNTYSDNYKIFRMADGTFGDIKYVSGTMESQGSITSLTLVEIEPKRQLPVASDSCYKMDKLAWDTSEQ